MISEKSWAAGPGHGAQPLLELEHLVKEYPVGGGALRRSRDHLHAVSDVSLTVEAGTTLGLVGESGCGKSTLGRMVVGLEEPTSGQVRFEGTDLTSLSRPARRRARRDLQLMFQDPYASLDPRMKVRDIVAEPLAVQRQGSRAERRAKVRSLLDEVGLPQSAEERYPYEFSGGQRQRIGLARALALSPKVIVADEPVSALDVSIRSQILNLMGDLQRGHGLTYLVISHDLTVVRYIADQIGVMYLGKLVEQGPADAIYGAPAHPYTRALIDTIPTPDPARERAKGRSPIRGELPSAVHPPSGCRFRTRCPRVQSLCAEEEPAMRSFGTGHIAACHFPLTQASAGDGEPSAALGR